MEWRRMPLRVSPLLRDAGRDDLRAKKRATDIQFVSFRRSIFYAEMLVFYRTILYLWIVILPYEGMASE